MKIKNIPKSILAQLQLSHKQRRELIRKTKQQDLLIKLLSKEYTNENRANRKK